MYFSKGGTVILVKSTLFNFFTYFMSFFPLPMGIAKHIERLHQDFLWGGLSKEFKFHLVSWSNVGSPISKGELWLKTC
jgi:hypothetical protein